VPKDLQIYVFQPLGANDVQL